MLTRKNISFPRWWKGLLAFTLLYFSFQFILWNKTDGLPGMMEQMDTFGGYNAGKNLVNFGAKSLWLEDNATSSDASAHPYLYTHNPDFAIYWSGLLQAVGVNDIRHQTLIQTMFLYLGLLFCFAFFYKRFGVLFAGVYLAVALFNYLGVLAIGFNLIRGFSFIVFWGTLLAYQLWLENPKRFVPLFVALFFCVFLDWGITCYILALLGFDQIFSNRLSRKVTYRQFLVTVGVGLAIPLGVHFLHVAWVIGPKVLWQDFFYTVGNRTIGIPTKEAISQFYFDNRLVLWAYSSSAMSLSFLTHVFSETYRRILTCLGPGVVELTLLTYGLCFFHWKDSRARLFIAFFTALLAILVAFPKYFFHIFIHPFQPLFVFSTDFAKALLILFLVRYGMKRAMATGTVMVLGLALWQWKMEPPRPLPASQALGAYHGKTFVTNYYATYPSYYTQTWSSTAWGKMDEGMFSRQNTFEADKTLAENDKYAFPDYALCVNHDFVDHCRVSESFLRKYPKVAEGKDFAIFDLTSRRKRWEEGRWATGFIADRTWSDAASLKIHFPQHPRSDLFDGLATTYWELGVNPSKREKWGWLVDRTVETTLKFEKPFALNVVAIQLADDPEGVFDSGLIEGRGVSGNWEYVAEIIQPRMALLKGWTTWEFNNRNLYSEYRLFFSPREESKRITLAEIRFGNRTQKTTLP